MNKTTRPSHPHMVMINDCFIPELGLENGKLAFCDWLDERGTEYVYRYVGHGALIRFNNINEALLFKLVWGGQYG